MCVCGMMCVWCDVCVVRCVCRVVCVWCDVCVGGVCGVMCVSLSLLLALGFA